MEDLSTADWCNIGFMRWKRVLVEAFALLVAAALVGAAGNALRPEARKLAWLPRMTPPPKDPSLIYLEISSEEALRLQRAGALFIDARRSSAYEQGHIERAINIPVWEHDVDSRIAGLQAQGIKSEDPIVVYCSGGRCEDAVGLANRLAVANFYNIYLYKEGFPDWQGRRWPVSQGKLP
jgi:rhodanese-related sulfurtransferase